MWLYVNGRGEEMKGRRDPHASLSTSYAGRLIGTRMVMFKSARAAKGVAVRAMAKIGLECLILWRRPRCRDMVSLEASVNIERQC